jgi:uncharacterized membrane protein
MNSNRMRFLAPGTILSISVSALLNSIRFYEEARKQITVNQLFLRSITWYSILLVIAMLLAGIFIGLMLNEQKQSIKRKK